MYVCVVCVCAHTRTHTHAHTHARTYTFTYAHTHARTGGKGREGGRLNKKSSMLLSFSHDYICMCHCPSVLLLSPSPAQAEEYGLPYDTLVSAHPSVQEMRDVVTREQRPCTVAVNILFPYRSRTKVVVHASVRFCMVQNVA